MCTNGKRTAHDAAMEQYYAQSQCQQQEYYVAPAPEVLLARLISSDLNVTIDPKALRMFLRARWSRVSPLAHEIHA